MPRQIHIASYRMADGGLAYIERMGRTYCYGRTSPQWLEQPVGEFNLTLSQARYLYANAVKADLFETDGD